MTDQHRATPEQWASQKAWAVDDDDSACLIDLHARVEALEAAQQDKLDRLIALDAAEPTPDPATPESHPASPEVRPAGGLVERVAGSIWKTCDLGIEARAAIREVAAAARLRDLNGQSVAVMTWEMVAQWLEQEANQ
jgi:hypothetical protein